MCRVIWKKTDELWHLEVFENISSVSLVFIVQEDNYLCVIFVKVEQNPRPPWTCPESWVSTHFLQLQYEHGRYEYAAKNEEKGYLIDINWLIL